MASKFAKDAGTMLVGNTVSQLIPFLVMPILSRIYTPEEFGVFALYSTIVIFVACAASLRYEVAIVIGEGEDEAIKISAIATKLALTFSLLLLAILVVLHAYDIHYPSSNTLRKNAFLLPVGSLLLVFHQVLMHYSSRHREYFALATSSVLFQTVTALSRIGIGLWGLFLYFNGLISGLILGQAASILFLTSSLSLSVIMQIIKTPVLKNIYIAKKYYRFAVYNFPMSLLVTLFQDLAILALTLFNMVSTAGQFALTKRILSGPFMLIAGALRLVYYKEASDFYGTEKLERSCERLLYYFSIIFAPPFAFCAVFGEEIFAAVFGDKWGEAGLYAQMYALPAYIFTMTAWQSRIFEVVKKQHIPFFIDLIVDVIAMVCVYALLKLGFAPAYAVGAYCAGFAIYGLLYYFYALTAAQFTKSMIGRVTGMVFCYFIGFAVVFLTLDLIEPLPMLFKVSLAFIMAALFYIYMLRNDKNLLNIIKRRKIT